MFIGLAGVHLVGAPRMGARCWLKLRELGRTVNPGRAAQVLAL